MLGVGVKGLSGYVSVKICKISTIEDAFQEDEDSCISYGLTKTQKDHAGKGRGYIKSCGVAEVYIVAKPDRTTEGWKWW
jgi:hypothetical protein